MNREPRFKIIVTRAEEEEISELIPWRCSISAATKGSLKIIKEILIGDRSIEMNEFFNRTKNRGLVFFIRQDGNYIDH